METIIIVVFIIGYLLIALEHPIKINKTATALVTGVTCWALFALSEPAETLTSSAHYASAIEHRQAIKQMNSAELFSNFIKSELSHHLAQISSILFFLMGAMTIVELIDAHHGFRFITDKIRTVKVRKLLWLICWTTFFLSAALDNLTTAIVMVSMTRKLISDLKTRMFFAGMIVIAANAGGAWSPIGDVTTTMLWIGGQVSAGAIIQSLLVPSMVCMLAPLVYLSFTMKGTLERPASIEDHASLPPKRSSQIILFAGIAVLISVPVFKTVTHLPPYMGMLLGLGVLWCISEFINPNMDENERKKYSAAHALSRIDVSSMLFFMGILLAVGALETMQVLHHLADSLDTAISDSRIIISVIGVVSAIVDNVPLVAACMGMYSIETYPMDHAMWEYLAYCAGTGGSLLIIGSAAGVAVMGMEKIDFIWYVRKMTMLAFIGYVAGAAVYLGLHTF